MSIDKDIKSGRFNELTTTLPKKIKPATIKGALEYALATGNWSLKNQQAKKGVAQVLGRISYLSSLSHREEQLHPLIKTPNRLHPENYMLHNLVDIVLVKHLMVIQSVS